TLSFTLVAMLVTPALAENSPPAIVVGTLIWRTLGAVIGGGAPFAARMASILSTVRILLARQSCTAFAPSVIEPPPTVTMRSASAARACSLAAITASRGVCWGMASKTPEQWWPRARSIFAISSVSRRSVPDTIRKAREARRRSICLAIASAAGSPNTTSSIAPKTTRPLCTFVLPETISLCLSIETSEGNLLRHVQRWSVYAQDAPECQPDSCRVARIFGYDSLPSAPDHVLHDEGVRRPW